MWRLTGRHFTSRKVTASSSVATASSTNCPQQRSPASWPGARTSRQLSTAWSTGLWPTAVATTCPSWWPRSRPNTGGWPLRSRRRLGGTDERLFVRRERGRRKRGGGNVTDLAVRLDKNCVGITVKVEVALGDSEVGVVGHREGDP